MFYPIDDTILPIVSDAAYAYTNASNGFAVYFPGAAGSSTGVLFRGQDGYELRLSQTVTAWHASDEVGRQFLAETQHSTPVTNGNSIRYPDRLPGIAELWTVRRHGLKHTYVLDAPLPSLRERHTGFLELSEVVTLPDGHFLSVNGQPHTTDFTTPDAIQLQRADGRVLVGTFPAPLAHEGMPAQYDAELDEVIPLTYRVFFINEPGC